MSSIFGTGRSANLMRDLFISEHLWINFSSRNMLYQLSTNGSREKYRRKSHRVCRPDREPSRIPIRSLKRLRNKSRKVRKFVYARILICIPMSSILYYYVNAKKLLNKRTFKFNCRERIRQSIRKVKYHASRYLTCVLARIRLMQQIIATINKVETYKKSWPFNIYWP